LTARFTLATGHLSFSIDPMSFDTRLGTFVGLPDKPVR